MPAHLTELPNGGGEGLNLPPIQLRTCLEEGIVKVYDPLRHKYVALTPEEFVRQHFVNYLTRHLHYPKEMTANEVSIELNSTSKRCDTVVYGHDGLPLMIVEYKAPSVTIRQDTFDQIVRYNMKLRARYLVVSNGLRHYCCVADYESGQYHFLPKVPDFRELT